MTDTTELEGKVAIVTGAGQGMGKHASMRLASSGAQVVVNDVNAEAVEQTVADIKKAGGVAIASAGSVTSSDAAPILVRSQAKYSSFIPRPR